MPRFTGGKGEAGAASKASRLGRAGLWALTLGTTLVIGAAWLLLRSPGGGPGPGNQRTEVGFVGAARCASCHSAEYAAWSGSQHDRAMQEATDSTVLGDFDGVELTADGVTSRFFRRDGKFFVRTMGAGRMEDFEIRYTFGVEPLQQYLVERAGGHVQPLSLAWDSRPAADGGQRWFALYPGEGVEHGDELHWTGRAQNWNFMCADCHSTNVKKGYDPASDAFQTTWSEIDVSCEACHGPGGNHAEWAESPRVFRALLGRGNGLTAQLTEREGIRWVLDEARGVPVRSAPRETTVEIQVCAQCHSRRTQTKGGYTAGAPLQDHYTPALIMPGLYHPDGQQRDEVYTHVSFLQSRMFHAGVTCSDCHEPHSQQLRAPGNALCAQCHSAATYDAPEHHRHARGSEGGACVSCHMPAETYMQVDPRRDHSIRVPRPDLTVALGTPNACASCHAERGAEWAAAEVRRWYGRDARGFQTFAEAFHADERGAADATSRLERIVGDTAQPDVVRASALARMAARPEQRSIGPALDALSDPDPDVRRAALLVLEALPVDQRTGPVAPLLSDPARSVRFQAAWLLAGVSGALEGEEREAFSRASMEFVESQRFNADRAESRVTLGSFLLALGRTPEAIAEYRAAIRLEPRAVAAYVNLADLYRAQGLEPEAERFLREGLAAAPNDPDLHHSLGLSLARSGRPGEAVEELGRAAALAPERTDLAYGHAVALNSVGRAGEAIRVLEAALARSPRDRDLLFALATFERDRGGRDAALEYARRLVAAHPADAEARALLGSL